MIRLSSININNKYLLIFLLAFLSRIIHGLAIYLLDGNLSMDLGGESRYTGMAEDFVNTGNMYLGYSYLSRTPLYMYFLSFFMSLFDDWKFYLALCQIGITSLTCMIIMRSAEMIKGSWALPAGIVAALCPSLIIYGVSIQPEPLFVLFLSLSIMLTLNIFTDNQGEKDLLRVFFLSICLCLAAYTRVASFFLPLFFFPCLIYFFFKNRHKSLMRSLIISSIPVFVMIGAFSPRLVSSYLDHNRIIITTQSGTSHVLGHVYLPIAVASGKNREDVLNSLNTFSRGLKLSIEREAISKTFVDQSTSVEYREVQEHQKSMQEFWRLLKQETLKDIIYASSLGLVKSLLETSVNDFVFFQAELGFFKDNDSNLRILIYGLAIVLIFVRLLQFYSLSSIAFNLRKLDIFMLFSFYIMYFAVVNGPVGYVKYRLPMEPVLLILLGGAISQGYEFYCRHFKQGLNR